MTSRFPAIAVFCLVALCLGPARATVVEEFTFEELVAESMLVFEGRVLAHEQVSEDGLLYTVVRFAVDDVVRGGWNDGEIALRFAGGATAGTRVEIVGQYLPAIGDRGLYFIDDPLGEQLNPLTGWHQGAFLIETTTDGMAVLDLSQRPDLILLDTRAAPLVRKMLDAGFSEEAISARYPEYRRFPLQDFKDAVAALAAE